MGVPINEWDGVSTTITKGDNTRDLVDPISQCYQGASRIPLKQLYPGFHLFSSETFFTTNPNLTRAFAILHHPSTEHVIRYIPGS